MAPAKGTLTDPATYRGLAYLLSGMPLGLAWFVALTTVSSLCLGLVITPLVIPLVIALGFMVRGFAAVEAELGRAFLDVDAHAPAAPPAAIGLRGWLRGMFQGDFWRALAYLLIRSFAGFPLGMVIFTLLAAGLGMIFAPVWVPLVPGGAHLGFWTPRTFLAALALVPFGLLILPGTLLIVRPLASGFRPIASSLLAGHARSPEVGVQPAREAGATGASVAPERALRIHAAVDGVLVAGLALIWALTSLGYFWPIWIALPAGVALAIHGWLVRLTTHPALTLRFHNSRPLAAATGIGAVVALYFVSVWAITGHGYFWPIWIIAAIAVVLGVMAAASRLGSPAHAEMAERIETLETTRAGAVNLQDSELRRIERDLHDGAQARLVALGMSLGMAEQKLAEDPARVAELLAEARAGAEDALRELRNLARGIHPPVLADRGLEAALGSLVSSSAIPAALSVDLAERPAPAVETAAYFVAAEALANATKHAHADGIDVRVSDADGSLELRIDDDGIGGADVHGTGLLGMRRRVEALDGTLIITSPVGGPTSISARFPCAS